MAASSSRRDVGDPDKRRMVYSSSSSRSTSILDGALVFGLDKGSALSCLAPSYKCSAGVHLPRIFGDELLYPSVEHAFQASKFAICDLALREAIQLAKDAKSAKVLARRANVSEDWKAKSESTMLSLLRDKIRTHNRYRTQLLDTGHARLVYQNDHGDVHWGVDKAGKGANKLGEMLERVRDEARKDADVLAWIEDRLGPLALSDDVCVTLRTSKIGEEAETMVLGGKSIVTIGKVDKNDVVLGHPSASRHHALLVITQDKNLWLICLGASNGTHLDGEKVLPFCPRPVELKSTVMQFGGSKRVYSVESLEMNWRVSQNNLLYRRVAEEGESGADRDRRTVYVGNLAYDCTEAAIRRTLEACGEIFSVSMPLDGDAEQGSKRIKGFAFVCFRKDAAVSKALALDGDELMGRPMRINRPQASSTSSGGPSAKRIKH
jgi:ribA/ribD-fused uncharacterized protein